jgi:hypothetical protein
MKRNIFYKFLPTGKTLIFQVNQAAALDSILGYTTAIIKSDEFMFHRGHFTPNADFGPISDRVTFYFISTKNLNIHFLHLQTCFFPPLYFGLCVKLKVGMFDNSSFNSSFCSKLELIKHNQGPDYV